MARFINGFFLLLFFTLSVPGGLSAQDNSTLLLYNGQHKSATQKLIEAFEQETGIKVRTRDGASAELAHQIMEEGRRSPADVIYTEESSPLFMLKNNGLTTAIPADAISTIPANYKDEDSQWVGILGRSRVIVYNPALIAEADLPESVLDLTDSKWSGKFGFVPTSGAFQTQLSALIKLQGKDAAREWLLGLKKNGKIYRKNTVALDAVEKGQIPFSLINNYYWDKKAKEAGVQHMDSRLYFFGTHDLGDMLTIASMAVLESSKNKEAAFEFIRFAAGEKGQKILADISAQYALNPDVPATPGLKPFSELTPPAGTLDLGEFSSGEAAVQLLIEVGLL